ncbi:MAG: hypothetical protein NBV68_12445 [Erythrobacter sp.]|uniref:hypothetical protein n=1 Tax=Erythrobacter sp. TaxID=1042 RepID=UPI0025F0A56C|nr:hypothetical protein [Erythrobacter sp.]MCM0000187.1 hypothetical protein [Erythrobacter sp.]
MHKPFKTLALAGSAMTLAMTGTFAAAQEQMPDTAPGQTTTDQTTTDQTMPGQTTDTMPGTTPPSMPETTPPSMPDTGPMTETPQDQQATATPAVPSAEQDAMMQSWPADRQAGYKAWPTDTQNYFWSLNQQRREIFWALSDSDKVTLSQMPDAQRESTWAQIESRLTPPRG